MSSLTIVTQVVTECWNMLSNNGEYDLRFCIEDSVVFLLCRVWGMRERSQRWPFSECDHNFQKCDKLRCGDSSSRRSERHFSTRLIHHTFAIQSILCGCQEIDTVKQSNIKELISNGSNDKVTIWRTFIIDESVNCDPLVQDSAAEGSEGASFPLYQEVDNIDGHCAI
jgi:hypothetical protein